MVKYSEDPAQFIAAALAPADVVDVWMADEGKACRVIVPDDQLSLAIGKEGQNASPGGPPHRLQNRHQPESYHDEEEPLPGAPRRPRTRRKRPLWSPWTRSKISLSERRPMRCRK
ncbi:MAG: hypothetical protein ACLTG0_08170 [Oscillibacter sp.]